MTPEEQVNNHSSALISILIGRVTGKEPVDIRYEDFLKNDHWSVITTHIYEEDKEISLRLHAGDHYDLHLGYYDDKDEFFEIINTLTEEDKNLIPDKLKRVLKKVLDDEEGMRIPGNFLSAK